MGRPPKRSTFSYQDIEKALRAAKELAAPPYIPLREELLGYVIISLTERIRWMCPKKVSPKEYAIWRLIDEPNQPERDSLIAIIGAMLDRIGDADTDEYDHCRNHIARIAMLEAAACSPEQKSEIDL